MTTRYGSLVGAIVMAGGFAQIPNYLQNSKDSILMRDRIELAAAPADDQVFLARLPSNTVLDPDGCICWFDDLGTGITVDVGDLTNGDGLVDGQDVATAAGSFSLLKTVDAALYFEPLWKQLGMSADPGGHIDLYMTILGAAATGTVAWQIKGQKR